MKLLVWHPVYVLGGGFHVLRSTVTGFLNHPGIEQITLAVNSQYAVTAFATVAASSRVRLIRVDPCTDLSQFIADHDAIHVPWPHGIAFNPTAIPASCVYQDTILIDYLGGHATGAFLEEFEQGIRDLVAAYDRVILTSHYTRQRIIDVVGQEAAARLVVLPHMADELRSLPTTPLPAWLRPPFLVYPANAAEHKNHETLLQAVAKRVRRDVPVVFMGYETEMLGSKARMDRPYLNRINRLIRDSDLQQGQDFFSLGYVDDATAAAVRHAALGLVMPTRAEGMGLPIHDAINACQPVICSDIAVLREHYANRSEAILWVDPECPGEIAAALDQLVEQSDALHEIAKTNQNCGRTWSGITENIYTMLEGLTAAAGNRPCLLPKVRHRRGIGKLCARLLGKR